MQSLSLSGVLLSVLAVLVPAAGAVANYSASPIVVPSSQIWDGDDGQWSSFFLRLGDPQQAKRVLVSTSGTYVVAVLEQACNTTDAKSCAEDRGLTFNPSDSSTWNDQGFYALDQQQNLGIELNGNFGLDKVGLGIVDDPDLLFEDQVISGIIGNEFYIGSLGLSIQPTNLSDTFADPKNSLFTTLRDNGAIPSLTWSYTAGAEYRLTKVPGTLVFGGYDASLFTPNNLSIPMSPDSSRDLVVGLQSITASQEDKDDKNTKGNTTLLSSGVLTFVDSTLPYIWLPQHVCDEFEHEFGLTWNDTAQLYLLDDATHNTLTSRNIQFTFKIGAQRNGGDTVDIVLPYSSFDLTAKPPLVGSETKYFPIKPAANETQYTLGRAFLQESYLIADYERSNFSLSQCTWVSGAKSSIVPITSVDAPQTSVVSASPPSSGISGGAIAGIVVGVVGGLGAIGGVIAFFLISRRKKSKERDIRIAEMSGVGRAAEISANNGGSKDGAGGDGNKFGKPPIEMEAHPDDGFYAPKSATAQSPPQELGAQNENVIHEMFDESVFRELPDTAGTRKGGSPDTENPSPRPAHGGLLSPLSPAEPSTPLPLYREETTTGRETAGESSRQSVAPRVEVTGPDADKKEPPEDKSEDPATTDKHSEHSETSIERTPVAFYPSSGLPGEATSSGEGAEAKPSGQKDAPSSTIR